MRCSGPAGIPGPYILVGHSFGGLTVRYYALRYPSDVAGMVLVDGSAPYAIANLDLSSERLDHAQRHEPAGPAEAPGLDSAHRDHPGIGASPTWRATQKAMVGLSTHGRQVIATKSDHWIQLRQPDLVIREIRTVVRRRLRKR